MKFRVSNVSAVIALLTYFLTPALTFKNLLCLHTCTYIGEALLPTSRKCVESKLYMYTCVSRGTYIGV